MYGPPQAPQSPQVPPPKSPASGGLVALRVLFCALSLLSCGFLSWAPLLRLAVVTGKRRDWVLFGLALLGSAGLFTYIVVTGEETGSDLEAFLGIGAIVLLAAGSITYYLVAEIRHFERLRAQPPTQPPYRPMGYAYGADGTAVTAPSAPGAPNPYICAPPPVPPVPAPRIDQVRAELDELSDLLRTRGEDDGRA